MAVVQGIREKVHLPLYDSLSVEAEKQLREAESSSTLKFFVNVQGKTKLQTNLQSASLLPHYNTFEARAMRVVLSDLPPKVDFDPAIEVAVTGSKLDYPEQPSDVRVSLDRVLELLEKIECSTTCPKSVQVDVAGHVVQSGAVAILTKHDVLEALSETKQAPPLEQIHRNNGCGTIIGRFIFNTVTSLFVGEKEMIKMPTWFFPGGAGPF